MWTHFPGCEFGIELKLTLGASDPMISFLFICIYFQIFIYLFIWLHQVLVAAHRIFVAVRGLLSSCGARAPEHVGSVVALHRLSSRGTWA